MPHSTALMTLLLLTGVIAMFITPADPLSMLIVLIPMFLVAVVPAYFLGVRKGRQQQPQSTAGHPMTNN